LNEQTPTGGDVTQRSDTKPAFSENLFERVLQRGNILSAWQHVRANKGAAGVDGISIDAFPDWAKSGHWKRVISELRAGRYHPSPVRRVEIEKPDGGMRQLGIPTVIDRVIQQAIAQVLMPIFDPDFSSNSFGFLHIGMGNKPSSRYKVSLSRAGALLWMQIYRSSLIGLIMIC